MVLVDPLSVSFIAAGSSVIVKVRKQEVRKHEFGLQLIQGLKKVCNFLNF